MHVHMNVRFTKCKYVIGKIMFKWRRYITGASNLPYINHKKRVLPTKESSVLTVVV